MQATILNREIALKMINKSITDIVAVISMLVALVTGFMLHNEIHHSHIYHDVRLWSLHETSGLVWKVIMVLHCVQHTPWFKNYTKIPLRHKAVSTLLLVLSVLIAISGLLLMFGSRSQYISIVHYVLGIIFALAVVYHAVSYTHLTLPTILLV